MARTTVTESDLGLDVTEEEMAGPPVIADDNDDDISLLDDPDEPEKPAPEKSADPEKPADPTKPDEAKTVDLRALQEARAEAREARRENAVLAQRWNDFLAGQGKPEATKEAPVIPKASEDPLAAMQWTQEQLIAMRDAQEAERTQTATEQREQAEFQAVASRVVQDFTTQAGTDPTLNQAYDKLRESQANELLAMGYTVPEAKGELDRLEREHIKFVAARNIPIGDYIKALATARGWSPTAAATPAAKTDLKAVADAQQRHQSLSDAPGGEAVPPLDAKALARMSDKDFKAWMSKKGNEAKFDEIMGR